MVGEKHLRGAAQQGRKMPDIGAAGVSMRARCDAALFTVEGERDDICGIVQTLAAQELCSGLRPT
jgi:poly-beta-hydroxyalkanoate depolymerase